MPGMGDPLAIATLNDVGGSAPFYVTLGSTIPRYLALFTAAPNDSGTGGTEVSGPGYARVQLASQLPTAGAWTTASTTITLSATAPAWLLALGTTPGLGAAIYDISIAGGGALIGQVQSIAGAVLTLQAPALAASQGAADNVQLSAFLPATASVGAEPSTTPAFITNSAQINFGAVGAGGWGTVVAWGIYDTLGNLRFWDYLGSQAWANATFPTGSIITAPAHGQAANQPFVVSAKAGGNFPSFSAGSLTNNVGTLLVTSPSGNGLQASNAGVAVVASTSGDFMWRGISPQLVPPNSTPVQFAAGGLALYAA